LKKSGYLYALCAVLIWSGFILVSRLGGISELSSYDVIAIRYASCALVLFPVWIVSYIKKTEQYFSLFSPKFITISLIGGMAYALCTFKGFEMTSASHAAILLPGLLPLFITLLSTAFNKGPNREPTNKFKWTGISVITLGIAILFYQQVYQNSGFSVGHIYLIAGAFFWALFSVLIKCWQITPWQATLSLAMITSIIYIPLYITLTPNNLVIIALTDTSLLNKLFTDILIQAFYQGVLAMIVQMVFYVRAIQIIGPSSMGSMMAIVPIVSGISALFVFNEAVTVALIIAFSLVSLGTWITHSPLLRKSFTKREKLCLISTSK